MSRCREAGTGGRLVEHEDWVYDVVTYGCVTSKRCDVTSAAGLNRRDARYEDDGRGEQ
jgi:hypothetical protein